MSGQNQIIVRAEFGNDHDATCLTTENVNLMLSCDGVDGISDLGNQMTIILTFAFFLFRRSFTQHCRRPNRFICMIFRRIFRILPSNFGEVQNLSMTQFPELRFQHRELYTGIAEFSFAVNMVSGWLRGDIRLSFSEIVHSLFVIQRHMLIAFERNSIILTEIEREENKRSRGVLLLDPYERLEVLAVNYANDYIVVFQQRFSDFIERCCFYLCMQIRRSLYQLR